MILLVKVLTALILVAVLSVDKTAATCCNFKYISYHVCLGTPQEKDVRNHLILDFPLDKSLLYWIRNEEDLKRAKCVSYFCADGSYAEKYNCGVGKCNMFGCACEGGCRKSYGLSNQEMAKVWREEHGLLMKAKHHLKGKLQ